jgi:integrase
MASIQQRGPKWSVRFTYLGKKYRLKVGTGQKALTLKQLIEDTLTDIQYGRIIVPDDVCLKTFIASGGNRYQALKPPATLSETADEYLRQAVLANSTHRMYTSYCRRLIRFAGPDVTLAEFDIYGYIKLRTEQVHTSTVSKELILLRNLYRQAGVSMPEVRMKTNNTSRQFTPLESAGDGRCVLLTRTQTDRLRQVVRENGSSLIADVVEFVCFTAARRSEVTRLTPEDIDWTRQRVTIRELKRKHGSCTFRVLPIHPQLEPMLRSRTKGEFIFTHSVNTISSGLRKALRGSEFDLPGFGLHAIRHSIASELIHQGTPVTVVSELLGHTTPVTTLSVYSHAFDKGLKEAVSLL